MGKRSLKLPGLWSASEGPSAPVDHTDGHTGEDTGNAFPHLILLVDDDGVIRRCSTNVEQWSLSRLDSIIGMPLHTFFHPHCHDQDCHLMSVWREARRKVGQKQSHECIIRDFQEDLELSLVFHPIPATRDQEPSSLEFFAVLVVTDIGHVNDVKEELRLFKTELDMFYHVIPHIFLRLTRQGMIVDWASRLMEDETFPLRLEKGHFVHYIFPISVVGQFIDAMNQSFREKMITKIQYQLPAPRGNLLFDASFMPLGDDEMLVISRDITERTRLENIAESVQMMSNLGYIFSGIRHEIGNPINSMKMTLSVLKNNIGNYSPDKILEYTDRVLNEINRVEYLLTSLKNFNMYENLVLKDISLLSFIDNFLLLVKEDFEGRGIMIETDLTTQDDMALADSRALQQVMLNLFSNAADAFLESEVRAQVVIGLYKRGKTLELTVRDNGVGMSQYQLDNLFKPFFTSKPHGTGLGLVIVKKLMMQIGGNIAIESKVGEGTLVRLTLGTA
ncbi:MAG: PAS domain-containing sensor histidine kinase [Syntrophales bacterium]|jgi:signal transduction histidine kinase|nr:PAS domain-containing sensor histidine kinase [Syntrophales bacterium]